MLVTVGNSVHAMTRVQAELVMGVASTYVPHGIYAVVRDGAVELRRDVMEPADVPAAVEAWLADGFEVRYNA